MQKNSSVFVSSFLHLKPDFRYILVVEFHVFSDLVRVEPKINLQLTGKNSIKLDSNYSFLDL